MPVVLTQTTTNDRLWINTNPDEIRVAVIETSLGSGELTCSMFHVMLEDKTNHYSLVRYLDDFKELDLLLYKHFPKQRIPLPKLTESLTRKRFSFKRKRNNSSLIEKYLTSSIQSLIGQSSLFRDFLSAQREEDRVISKKTVRQLVKKHVAPVRSADEVEVTPPHTLNGDVSINCQQQQQQQQQQHLPPSPPTSHAYVDLPVYQTHLAPLDDGDESDNDDIICSNETKNPSVRDFELIKVLGKGATGKVILARHHRNQNLYALKSITKAWHVTEREVEHVKMERDILATIADVRHPFLVRLHQAFQDQKNLYLVLDYHAGADLSTLLQRYFCFPADVCRLYGAEIMMGLQELHRHGILYRDLKPENVLLAADGHIVLTDFGLSKMFEIEDSFYHNTFTFCGTPDYMAPEIITGEAYSYAADYWSFGTMLYEMLVGIAPFAAENHDAMFERVLYDDLLFPSTMDIDAVELIAGLLRRDPLTRLSDVYSLRCHPYFTKHLNWKDVHAKRIVPSYIPKPSSETDLSHFDPGFLKMSMTMNEDDSSLYRQRWHPELKSAGLEQDAFRGYSYMDDKGYTDLDRYYQSEMSFSTVDYCFSDDDEEELKMDSTFSFDDHHPSLPPPTISRQLRHTPKSNILKNKFHPSSDTSLDDEEEEGGLTNEMVEELFRQLEVPSFAKDHQTNSATNDMNEDRSMALNTVPFNCNDNIRNSKIITSSIDDVSPWRS